MNTATADGSRALYGISRDGMTIKELGRLNRFNVPGNAMSLDTIINILFVLFVGNIFGILAASNIGYVLAHMFALSGYVLLRKDRPNWPRPIKLPAYLDADRRRSLRRLVPRSSRSSASAGSRPPAGGYGKGTKVKIIGVAVLGASLLLFLFRRIVQDGETAALA